MTNTIVGVLVGWGLATVAEVVRWWRQSQVRDGEHKTAIRRAARLILEELLVAEKATQKPKRGDPFAFTFGERQLPTSVWNANRDVLAVSSEEAGEWETIASAYARIDELNWAFWPPKTRTPDEIDALLAGITEIHAAVVDAEGALRRLIGQA